MWEEGRCLQEGHINSQLSVIEGLRKEKGRLGKIFIESKDIVIPPSIGTLDWRHQADANVYLSISTGPQLITKNMMDGSSKVMSCHFSSVRSCV